MGRATIAPIDYSPQQHSGGGGLHIRAGIPYPAVYLGPCAAISNVEVPPQMSFVVAVLPPDLRDLVFCSDGLQLGLLAGANEFKEEATVYLRPDMLKTLALNEKVCISVGASGAFDAAFLRALIPDIPWDECPANQPLTNFADAYRKPLQDVSLTDARDEIRCILDAIWDNSANQFAQTPILGGEQCGISDLYYYQRGLDGFRWFRHVIVPGLPWGFKPSDEYGKPERIVDSVFTLERLASSSIVELCCQALDLYAAHAFTCNSNACFRRLSRGFVNETREEALSSSPAPDPSALPSHVDADTRSRAL